ncbi:MAG: GNAT family N-acetyltransferase [Bacteroides sp. 43_108]|nr:MAG: GNAT family N-acetyltransferase [Bacteroides sp. 43_108]
MIMLAFTIRNWTENDIPALAKNLNNKKIWDNCRDGLPFPYTEKDAEEFIQFVLSQEIQSNYCIEINSEASGNIGFMRDSDVERFNAEIGYWLAEPYWNQGIMTEAIKIALESYFRNTDILRVYANVYANNVASICVLENVGFNQCGIHRKACFKNGSFVDCHYFELLKEDFVKILLN